MTNNWADLDNSSMFYVQGANPAENHPASIAHLNTARYGAKNAKLVVIDPRMTRTARLVDRKKGDYYGRIRPGTDIAFINGVLNLIFEKMYAAKADAGHVYHQQALNFFDWHNGVAPFSTAKRAFIADDGSAVNVTGWPKYCDSRMAVNTANNDYVRETVTSDEGKPISNMPKREANVDVAGTVFQKLRTHVSKYPVATVTAITGCTPTDLETVANLFIENSRFSSSDFGLEFATPTAATYKAATIMYAMGITQHTCGSQNIRDYAILQTMMGNMGRAGGGINALRGIHNVQGSTDMAVLYDGIPGYSGNPAEGQVYADYSNKLFGNRVVGVTTRNPYVPADLGLQQRGFYNMTREWFGSRTIAGAPTVYDVQDQQKVLTGTTATLLDGGPLVATTLVVTNLAGDVTYTKGVHYTVDCAKGSITRIDGVVGGIASGDTVVLDYQYRRDPVFDKMYDCWPKGNGVQHIEAFRRMCPTAAENPTAAYHYAPTADKPRIAACVVWGQNPAITEPNQSAVRTGLENLDLLVCVDMFANETAQCSRKETGVTYLLPACAHVEEAGSVTSSGRWIQWRDRATLPKGNSKADLELLLRFAKALSDEGAFDHIKSHAWVGTSLETTDPWETLYGKYGWDGVVPFDDAAGSDAEGVALDGSEWVAEQVFKEIAAPLNNTAAGEPMGTLWIYSGNGTASAYNLAKGNTDPVVAGSPAWATWAKANRAKSRMGAWDHASESLQYPRYGWAWLLNRRIFYNNSELKGDVNDVFVAPGFLARLFTINTNTLADWSTLYRAYNTLADRPDRNTAAGQVHELTGRFPGHTEPYETPKKDFALAWGYNTAGGSALVPGDSPRIDITTPAGETAAAEFPLILTSIRCVEHFQGGPITRNNEWNVELEPDPWVEINSVDALKYGIADGDWVNVETVRGGSVDDQASRTITTGPLSAIRFKDGRAWNKGFKARVGVGTAANQRVQPGVVAIPWHWGDRGLGTGARANDLCIDAYDANTRIPEYKACLCKISKINS